LPVVSVLVVSYNVRELLLDTLQALFASRDVDLEVVVVDNASEDGSAEAVEERYPHVRVIRMRSNVGFGRANNAGFGECHGRFVLLLNPDVLAAPDCVARLADFLLVHSEAGAVGPKLTRPDGGLDLAARRSFPSPMVALYRILGLSRLFPNSRRFGRYNLSHVSPDQLQEIDAGTGACLMLRRAAIERVGFFDPDFFMYGEDLDLCYRIKEGGWKVYYLPSATAIHVKGAASRQYTQRMLWQFHSAMWTFHDKHYADDLPAFGNGLIWAGIWLRWLILSARAALNREAVVSP
jgi:GT2 family glycosyltransferase